MSLLLETLGEVQKRLNPKISLTTIVLTMFDSRTRLANDVAENVKKHFPNELINIPIPRAVDAFPCGSKSITKTFKPPIERAAAKLTAVVVLPTPPF